MGLACLLVLPSPPVQAEDVTAIRCGQLLNPVDGSLTRNAVIVVRGDRIEQVGADLKIPDGARVIDLSGHTVLPGLIDSHTHILLQPEDERGTPPVITKSQAFRTVQGVAAAKKDLEAGFTTLRDVDSEGAGFADVAIRDAINRGIIPGPRLLVSTLSITITGGHMNNAGLNPDIYVPEPAAIADSRDAMVAEVRRQVKYGADWIKLYATGTLRHVDPVSLEPLGQVSIEDVKAIVAEAKRWHRDVAAHAYGGDGAKNAIRGGVRSIEHGMMLDDEALKLMVEHGTYWCPTLSTYIPATRRGRYRATAQDRCRPQGSVQESHAHGGEDRIRHGCRGLRARNISARIRSDGRVWNEADRCDSFSNSPRLRVAENGA